MHQTLVTRINKVIYKVLILRQINMLTHEEKIELEEYAKNKGVVFFYEVINNSFKKTIQQIPADEHIRDGKAVYSLCA